MANLGQLLMTGISGTHLKDDEREFLEKNDIGGVLLFAHNYESPGQLAELVNSIQTCRTEYPLFIAVDHEGGRVVRFKKSFTQFPAALEVASTESPKLCFNVAKIMAEELIACGINVNLSPVSDIYTNKNNKVIGDRAYGTNEEEVSKFITAMIRGFQTHQLIACAKHFPGHGDTTKDSHFDLPIVKTPMEQLKQRELLPFVKAVRARVEMVMMAHLMVDAIDTELPCSLSPKAYDLLRSELKFNKVIITDDMQMKAITDHFGTAEAAVMAIQAGADIVEYKDMDQAKIAFEGLKEAYKTKKIKNSSILEKNQRILELKKAYLSEYKPIYLPDLSKNIGTKASQVFLEELQKEIENKKAQVMRN